MTKCIDTEQRQKQKKGTKLEYSYKNVDSLLPNAASYGILGLMSKHIEINKFFNTFLFLLRKGNKSMKAKGKHTGLRQQ